MLKRPKSHFLGHTFFSMCSPIYSYSDAYICFKSVTRKQHRLKLIKFPVYMLSFNFEWLVYMFPCSVLDLDAFERTMKAEGLGVGSEGTAGEKNMHDKDFTCALFRFLQLLCEGHNLGTLWNLDLFSSGIAIAISIWIHGVFHKPVHISKIHFKKH